MIYIFDLDGTMTDPTKRLPLVKEDKPPDWPMFEMRAVEDPPIIPVVELFRTLLESNRIKGLRIWTSRSERYRPYTEAWVRQHLPKFIGDIRMRPANAHAPDFQLKQRWAKELLENARWIGGRPHPPYTVDEILIFEDRSRCVDAYRELGLRVCQVAKGDY